MIGIINFQWEQSLFQEVEVEQSTHFSLITHRTAAPVVVLLVLASCERQLDDVDWVIMRIKAETGISTKMDEGWCLR